MHCLARIFALTLLLTATFGWRTSPLRADASTNVITLPITSTVANNCSFGTSTLAFGAYDQLSGSSVSGTGSLLINCTYGDTVAFTANAGLNSTHAGSTCATATCTRAMANGTNYLPYDLYTTAGHTTVWNASNSISASSFTGTANVSVSVFGYIPASIARPAGSYSDTITVTATF